MGNQLTLMLDALSKPYSEVKRTKRKEGLGEGFDNAVAKLSEKLYKAGVSHVGQSKNMAISPYSIALVIALLALGARGPARQQIEQIMNINLDDPAVTKRMTEVINDIPCIVVSTTTQIVNEILLSGDILISPAYISTVASQFNAVVRDVNLNNAERVRQKINKRVSNLTLGMIEEAFSLGSMPLHRKITVFNTMFMKGAWLDVPPNAENLVKPFFLDCNHSVDVPMVYDHGTYRRGIFDDLDAKAVYLQLQDHFHGALLILPNKVDGLEELERKLFASSYTPKSLIRKTAHSEVMLTLPKFEVGFKMNITETLNEIGISKVFESEADLSGVGLNLGAETSKTLDIAHESILQISVPYKIVASTCLHVYEINASQTPLVLSLTHPFMFYLTDKYNESTPLFVGRIMDPRSN